MTGVWVCACVRVCVCWGLLREVHSCPAESMESFFSCFFHFFLFPSDSLHHLVILSLPLSFMASIPLSPCIPPVTA